MFTLILQYLTTLFLATKTKNYNQHSEKLSSKFFPNKLLLDVKFEYMISVKKVGHLIIYVCCYLLNNSSGGSWTLNF